MPENQPDSPGASDPGKPPERANAGDKQVSGRNQKGQFLPGQSGNPAGRREGSRNRVRLALQDALEGHGDAIVERAVQMALSGNETALRLVLERLLPPVRERAIALELPKIERPSDVAEAVRRAVAAVAEGAVTPAEATAVLGLLDTLRKALRERPSDEESENLQDLLKA